MNEAFSTQGVVSMSEERTVSQPAERRPAPSRIAALTVEQGLREMEAGKLSSEQWTQACLERIASRNPVVKAWVYVNADKALERARLVDREGRRQRLDGVPLGLKDIIDTADMPTELGDPEIFPGRRPAEDAAVTRLMRELGVVLLGKNTVSRHSIMLPGPARNPHDPSRTPGASSAGSAAAVADFQTPISLGTQTGGSIVRPSTFCGAVGFKPTIDTLPYAGLRRYSRPLDTLGAIARSVADLSILFGEALGDPRYDSELAVKRDFTVGVWRPLGWDDAEPCVREAFDDAVARLQQAGVRVKVLDMPKIFTQIADDHDIIMAYDLARSFKEIRRDHHDKCDPALLEYLDKGDRDTAQDYARTLDLADACRRAFLDVARDVDVLATPATLGEAPEVSDTGSNIFIRIWTLLHNPSLTLPIARGPRGLPVGLQLVGFQKEDARFLYWARCVESILGTRVHDV
ncbi:amidase [Bordetella bronchiseptica]|uniref:amidase n=1 Tax=Bordetella bronchiseptica TaxID=518 RepID=UPI00052843CF|nr:amidase [Bordetella bronchiseptica]AUL14730.1 amidase [Bordetella bronchiseptica]AZW30120.1 amidase [Bordetella bronchiseptica]RSB99975.1 amidase [Bordetella bronchiseptica]RSC09039.1 amidase [Bordetella bronchiseptica]